MSTSLRIRNVEVEGRGQREVLVKDASIVGIGPMSNVDAHRGEAVLDGHGGALLPGLHDHHLHLFSLAARAASVWVGPPGIRDEAALASEVRAHDRRMRGRDWMRAIGWDDTSAGWLDRHALDQALPDRPLRVQHRSGALWVLNSAGLARLELDSSGPVPDGVECGADGTPTGRLFGLDHWLGARLGAGLPDLTEVSLDLARRGVTAVTDATAHNGPEEVAALRAARRSGALRQRLTVMTRPGEVGDGPVKLVLAERALPALADLVDLVVRAHDGGRPVAIHAASRSTVVLAVAALAEARARPTDRIEHASVVDPEMLDRIARLGATVVIQHNFLAESGDRYLDEVEADDRAWLYRGRAFLHAGIPLAAGSDAPVGRPDPWAAMDAAVRRAAPSGRILGPQETLTADEALALHLGTAHRPGHDRRRVRVGEPADLCLLDRPWRDARRALRQDLVVATVIAGEVVHP